MMIIIPSLHTIEFGASILHSTEYILSIANNF
jgi:hypothetical protein